ncbi:MAG: class I SAM-dependent methyltransferase [Myxococcota bacterium]
MITCTSGAAVAKGMAAPGGVAGGGWTAPVPGLYRAFDMRSSIPGSAGAWSRLREQFDVKTEEAKLGEHALVLPELVDPIGYIEGRMAKAPAGDLPYWTKIWPAAIVLASFVSSRKGGSGRVLELGAGLGVPALVAACCGRQVVISDLEPDALEFARAAVELNELDDRVRVMALDWTDPPGDLGVFDTILGSEVLYHPPLYPTLVALLSRLLAPSGTVFIAHEERPFGISFFELAQESFVTRTTSCRVRPGKDREPTKVYLHALIRK